MGLSTGGGIAAGIALMARDRGRPTAAGVVLSCPMLDDRDATVSMLQHDKAVIWDRATNRLAWSTLLGARRATNDVSIYEAPARATDLAGLPPVFIDCGSADAFRDEAVSFASAIWAAGGKAELHIWPGGFHAFETIADAKLSMQSSAVRRAWVQRALGTIRAFEGDGRPLTID